MNDSGKFDYLRHELVLYNVMRLDMGPEERLVSLSFAAKEPTTASHWLLEGEGIEFMKTWTQEELVSLINTCPDSWLLDEVFRVNFPEEYAMAKL